MHSAILARAAFVLILAITAQLPAHAEGVPEPEFYRMDAYRSPTPATLRGARVVAADEAFALWREGAAMFVDVMPRPPKPEGLPEGTIWRDRPRQTIPRAVWLPNVGYGRLAAETDGYFRRNLEVLSGGDKAKPLVFFCLADCWMSWNAAKRAREEYGYTRVIWFREGTDGWLFPEAPLVPAEPLP